MSQNERLFTNKAFHLFDKDKDGLIGEQDIIKLWEILSFKTNKDEIKSFIQYVTGDPECIGIDKRLFKKLIDIEDDIGKEVAVDFVESYKGTKDSKITFEDLENISASLGLPAKASSISYYFNEILHKKENTKEITAAELQKTVNYLHSQIKVNVDTEERNLKDVIFENNERDLKDL